MKAFLCRRCGELRSLAKHERICDCGASWGSYRPDGTRADIGGEAIPIGILNLDLARAVRNQPTTGQGERFEAFVIPRLCPVVTHEETKAVKL